MIFDQPLLPYQFDFVMNTESKYIGFSGGYGSGKTFVGIIRTLKLMMEDPKANVLYGMPSFDLLNMRVVPGFEKSLQQFGITYTYHKQEKTFKLDGLGNIYLRSFDNPNSYISFEVAHCILDELDTIKKDKAQDIWQKALSRIRQRTSHSAGTTISLVSTPDMGIQGFFYYRFVENPAPRTTLIKASTESNFFNPDDYVQTLKDTYEDEALVSLYLNGEFVSLDKVKQFTRYDELEHDTDRTIRPDDHLLIGVDFNRGCCAYTVAVKEDGVLHFVGEGYARDTMGLCEVLKGQFDISKITLCPDATGNSRTANADKSSITILKDAGFRLKHSASNPQVASSLVQCNNHLYKKRILVNRSTCPRLSQGLSVIGYDDRGKPEKFSDHALGGTMDDYVDTFRYTINKNLPLLNAVGVSRMKF